MFAMTTATKKQTDKDAYITCMNILLRYSQTKFESESHVLRKFSLREVFSVEVLLFSLLHRFSCGDGAQ